MRIGQGYDIHKLVKGRDLILGGVKIPSDKGLLGHSDADVLIHALIDSIFGATGSGDIGEHFPDNDPKYKNADSTKLLAEAKKILDKKYVIINIDSTIIAQEPKLSPYKSEIGANIAKILEIDQNAVSIKAKTKEGLDSTGRGESIEAFCTILIDEK